MRAAPRLCAGGRCSQCAGAGGLVNRLSRSRRLEVQVKVSAGGPGPGLSPGLTGDGLLPVSPPSLLSHMCVPLSPLKRQQSCWIRVHPVDLTLTCLCKDYFQMRSHSEVLGAHSSVCNTVTQRQSGSQQSRQARAAALCPASPCSSGSRLAASHQLTVSPPECVRQRSTRSSEE